MNMMQARDFFEVNGYAVKKLSCWMTAKNNDTIINLRFGHRGQRGRELMTAFVTEYPLFDSKSRIRQTGIRAREFSKAKCLSESFPGVRVCQNGVACADFMDGKLVKK
jgi:hypothetical protein